MCRDGSWCAPPCPQRSGPGQRWGASSWPLQTTSPTCGRTASPTQPEYRTARESLPCWRWTVSKVHVCRWFTQGALKPAFDVAPGQGTSTCAAPSSSLASSCPSLDQSWCWWEWSAQKLGGRRSWTLESHLPAGWTTLLEVLGTYSRAAKHCETLLELMCVVYFRDVFDGCVLLLWQQNQSRISRPQLCSSEVGALLTSISKLNTRQTDRFNGIPQVWNRSRCLCWLGRLNFTCCRRTHLQYICWEGRLSIKVRS